jgi:sterol 3beta-glucosyltransferase
MSSTDTIQKPTLRKVTIMTTGSRGDIQPFVAIGIALKKAGYAVRVMTQPSETHAMLCKDYGLTHVPFGVDVDRIMMEDEEFRSSMETGDTLKFFKCIASLVDNNTADNVKPFYDEFLGEGGKNRPDLLLVSYLNRYFGLYAKHVLKIPTIQIKLQHWVFDDPRRAPMGMPTLPLGMHKLIATKLMIPQDFGNFQKFDKCLADIIVSQNDTKGSSASSSADDDSPTTCLDDFLLYDQLLEAEVNHSPLLPIMICQSPRFKEILHPTLPPSTDWRFVGPAVIEGTDQMERDTRSFGNDSGRQKLQDFIDSNAEKKPVYMGWGSMIRRSTHEMAIFAVEALMRSHQRGIVLGGSAGLSMEVLKEAVAASTATNNEEGQKLLDYAKENVLFVDKAPHEWLFPKVSLTIHHGGAGTLNSTYSPIVCFLVKTMYVIDLLQTHQITWIYFEFVFFFLRLMLRF